MAGSASSATATMFRALDAITRDGRTPSTLDRLRVVARDREEFRLAAPPDVVQRVLCAVVRRLPG